MAQSPFPILIFQLGNQLPVASGYMVIHLNKDAISSTGQINSRVQSKVPLDSSGAISQEILFWPNSQLTPTDTYYVYSIYTGQGQRVSGPQFIQIGSVPQTGFGMSFGSSFAS